MHHPIPSKKKRLEREKRNQVIEFIICLLVVFVACLAIYGIVDFVTDIKKAHAKAHALNVEVCRYRGMLYGDHQSSPIQTGVDEIASVTYTIRQTGCYKL